MFIDFCSNCGLWPTLLLICFAGSVPGGLVAHPDGKHIVYPLGCTLIVKDVSTQKQTFLSGHSNNISCLACSPSGVYLASGQVTHMGFKADVIIWSFQDRKLYCRLSLHKVKVQAVAFSPNDKYLATLGGRDDNRLVYAFIISSYMHQISWIFALKEVNFFKQ